MYDFTEIVTDKLQLSSHVKVLKANEYNRYLKAQELVTAAEKKAEQILSSAQAVFEQKKQQGYDEGLKIAQKEQSRVMMDTIEQCRQLYKNSHTQMASIVMQAIRKLVGEFDEVDLTLQVTAQAMHAVTNQRQVTLHVAPSQVEAVKGRLGQLLKKFPEISYVEVTPDARVDPGGCLLETKVGVIDGTIDNQLEVIEEIIDKSLAAQSDDSRQ